MKRSSSERTVILREAKDPTGVCSDVEEDRSFYS
jgi:hypothetical protein